ncbi:flagellar hook-length control protein FliK [Vibrio harveyi]|uniref:flagellar hook-length control protein FliK n=1 Tax=Vibrio harveyi TaxID=669 RepID=UPI003BB68A9D
MMVTNSISGGVASQPTQDGKVMQARSEQGFSASSSQTQQEALSGHVPVPGFRLNAQALPKAPADTETTEQGSSSEDAPVDALFSSQAPATPANLAAQAQALMQGMVKAAGKQGESGQVTTKAINGSTQATSTATQPHSTLGAATPTSENQSIAKASATNQVKVSAADLQTLLNQPVQGQPLTANAQVQSPTAHAAHTNPTTPLAATQAQGAEWAAVRVDTSSGKWGEQMMQVLQDRVTLQAQQNLQEAKIRLDPPELGKLDLLVRVEGDRLSVQINANSAVTREALMQVSERLRTELQEQNFVHVDVNVGSDQGQERHAHDGNQEEASIFAARESNTFQSNTTTNYSEHWLNTQA